MLLGPRHGSNAILTTDPAAAAMAGLVVSTHQANITALTGIVPASGKGVIMRKEGDMLVIVGCIRR